MSDQIAPNDDVIINQFISAEGDAWLTVIRVMTVHWNGPHTPVSEWVEADEIPDVATPEAIKSAIRRILNNRQFFAICRECGERKPKGWMHDADICQGCAAKNHGVVY